MIDELWAAIEGYPDYAVSNYGQVKSIRFDRLLKPRTNSYGLQRVVLYKNRVGKDFYVHHLVAAAFMDAYTPGEQVRHRSGSDKSNNHVYNLRFKSGMRMGRLVKNPIPAHIRRVMIVETGMIFRNVSDCANYINGQTSSVYRVLRGDRPSHLGYTFQYVEETFSG